MPRMDGLAFVRQARAGGLCFAPILMLTTESDQAKRAVGAPGWLVKPVAPDELLGVIRQVLPGVAA